MNAKVTTSRFHLLGCTLLILVACWSLAAGGAEAAPPTPAAQPPAEKPAAKELTAATTDASTNDWLYVDNGSVKLGIKKSSGAGIAWISESKSDRNLVNNYDRGRQIQQSYYGRDDGTLWDKQPWRWNPVQGGDWKGNSAKVLEIKSTTNTIYAKIQPKHWASGADLPEVQLEQWITVAQRVVIVRYRMTYTGKETHPESDQEIPAIFVAPDLDTLVLYEGDKPWTNGSLSRTKPGWPNEYRNITEHWAAYVDKNDFGLGAYVKKSTRITCYRFGEGRAESGACSYFAPLTQFAIMPGKIFNYDLFLMLGTTKEIRDNIYVAHQALSTPLPSFAPPKK